MTFNLFLEWNFKEVADSQICEYIMYVKPLIKFIYLIKDFLKYTWNP